MANASMVLYVLVRRENVSGGIEFLLLENARGLTFPPTKFRPHEDLYAALARVMEGDLGLSPGAHFPEIELEWVENRDGAAPGYPGLKPNYFLYPVDVSLCAEALDQLRDARWAALDEIGTTVTEPNIQAICALLRDRYPELLESAHAVPSMDALANAWAHRNQCGVRVARAGEVRAVLEAGNRAFNLRVADPYLAYQKQGFGFTWSFFTPKDKQDIHVHGIPAVEIYGILEGEFALWYKPMQERGARVWRWRTLRAGDWAEVEPLHCHFGCWLTPEGLGTVVKAAASGELAGVGKLGAAGKTTCKDCSVHEQCQKHPLMVPFYDEYQKPYAERDYQRIRQQAETISRMEAGA